MSKRICWTAVLVLVLAGCSSSEVGQDEPPVEVLPSMEVPEATLFSLDLIAQTHGSTASILGLGCARAQRGSGFFLESGLLATNAHVVSGVDQPQVMVAGEVEAQSATGMAFDPVSDLALLSIPRPPAGGLALREAQDGQLVALVGFDIKGEAQWRPGRIAQHVRATGNDIYGQEASGRDALQVAIDVDQGHSGSALINENGEVVGVVFSSTVGVEAAGYAVQITELQNLVAELTDEPSGPGPCRS